MRKWLILLLALMALGTAMPVWADDWDDCTSNADDRRVKGCTAIIQAGGDDQSLSSAYFNRAGAYSDLGNIDSAIADYSEAIRLGNGTFWLALDARAASYFKQGDYDRAIADADEVIRINPQDAPAYNNRGQAYDGKGDYDRAISDLDKAIQLDPTLASAYNSRGDAYNQKGDYDHAILDLHQAIQLDPNLAMAYANRGIAYGNKGNYDQAIADYSKAIQLDPNLAIAFNNRGDAYNHRGDYDRAIVDLDEAIHLRPDFGLAFFTHGEVNDAKGELAKALADFREAARLIPEDDAWHGEALARISELEAKAAAAASTLPITTGATPSSPSEKPAVEAPVADTTADLGRRVALVIGNGNYASPIMPQLPNPPRDAVAIGGTLKKLGFDVDVLTDATKETMEDALARLAQKSRDADVTLIFYAGHGLQDQGRNYFAPVDATLSDESDLRRRFVRLDDVLDDLADAKGARILLLDACRDNGAVEALRAAAPKNRSAGISRGLARIPEAEGQLVAFATQPDRVAADGEGADSPFTTALIAHLGEPGIELRTVLTRVRRDVARATNNGQIPEVSDSLIGEIYLKPLNPAPKPVARTLTR